MKEFMARFNFRKAGSGLIGIEREAFLMDIDENIIPIAVQVLGILTDREKFGYELSACQLEDRVGPVALKKVRDRLLENEHIIRKAEQKLGFKRRYIEVAPRDMLLDVYPDPTGRYQQITKDMPVEILSAACRVTGVHIHVGMPDHETALRVYNGVLEHVDRLCRKGDNSGGERLAIYKIMSPDWSPPAYASWQQFYEKAVASGFDADPRKCWHLIRISVHGTIEFRMFGSTENLDEIVGWAQECHEICNTFLDS